MKLTAEDSLSTVSRKGLVFRGMLGWTVHLGIPLFFSDAGKAKSESG